MTSFGARWSPELKAISALGTVALGAAIALELALIEHVGVLGPIVIGLATVTLVGAALFTVRGYELRGNQLQVRRLLWSTPISLSGLRSIQLDPTLVVDSVRLLANGGIYSFTGLFRSRRIGRYRAYLTDLEKTVLLDLGDRRVAVSPDDPQTFVAHVAERFPGVAMPGAA